MTSEGIAGYTSLPRSYPFLPGERKRRQSLNEPVPAWKWINSYVISCSQMKYFIVCLMMLLIPCTENFRETCSIPTMEFITWLRLVVKQPPPCPPSPKHTHTHTQPKRSWGVVKKDAGAIESKMSFISNNTLRRHWMLPPPQPFRFFLSSKVSAGRSFPSSFARNFHRERDV